MDPCGCRSQRIQPLCDSGKVKVRVRADDARGRTIGGSSRRQYHRAGARGGKFFSVLGVGEKTDLAGTGMLQAGDLTDRKTSIANQFAAEAGNDIFKTYYSHG